MTSNKGELMPCPFCGKTEKLVETKPDTYGNQQVRCYECPCDGPESDLSHEQLWNNAYCWKIIESQRWEIEDLKDAAGKLIQHLEMVLGEQKLSGTYHLKERLKNVLAKHSEKKAKEI